MLKNKETDKESKEQAEILSELEKITLQLNANDTMFNLATDDDMIEAMIYEQKSLTARYAYLLKIAKEKGIRIDFTNRQQ